VAGGTDCPIDDDQSGLELQILQNLFEQHGDMRRTGVFRMGRIEVRHRELARPMIVGVQALACARSGSTILPRQGVINHTV
jgi:hypothetical protein